MKIIVLILFLIPSAFSHTYSQTPVKGHLNTIKDFVDGYNEQDFEKIRSTMSAVIKLVFSKNKIKEIYGIQHQILGNAKIDKIIPRGEQSYLINLKYDRDTTEVQILGLTISDKNKIIGISNPSFKLQFPKSTDTSNLSAEKAFNSIDSLVNLKHYGANFNGCILVLKNKKEFYKKSIELADFENKTKLNDSTLFDLASCSKQFTAMAIMILKEQSKLSYSNKIENYFPEFPYKNISIENLLTHTSGLPDYMALFEKHWDKSKIATNKDVLDYLTKYKPKVSFKPGKEYEYSNTGYAILSSIIEKISGKSFSDYLFENLFQPLGMKNSKVYNSKYSQNEIIDNYAKGYTYSPSLKQYVLVSKLPELDYYRYLDGITGDGAVHSTISDLAIWDNSLRDYKLVSKETFYDALQPYKTDNGKLSNYGFGWELQKDEKYEKLIYHSGNWGGNITFILHFLDKDLSIIILSNNEYFNVPKFAGKVATMMNRL